MHLSTIYLASLSPGWVLLKLGIVATAARYWVLGILQELTAIRI